MKKRSFMAMVVAVAVALSLSACYSTYKSESNQGRGVPSEEVVKLLAGTTGVEDVTFEYDPTYSPGEGGLFSSEGMDFAVHLNIKSGYHIDDAEAFLETVFQAAGAANEYSPDGAFHLEVGGSLDQNFGWDEPVSKIAGTSYDVEQLTDPVAPSVIITVNATSVARYAGAWPNALPARIDGITEGSPEITVPVALKDVTGYVSEDLQTKEEQIRVIFNRNTANGFEYNGDVTIVLYDKTGAEVASEVFPGTEYKRQLTYSPNGIINAGDYSAKVTMNDVVGFDTTEVDVQITK